ncbi:MAG TPA: diaminopimelate epimerase [Bdellovibrionota bacterium]|jgi:diaminopimelate epimerase|nr:diaminopimelate epimerase [Bdellovibrionota bacterium]
MTRLKKTAKKIKFWKYQSEGNDFVMVHDVPRSKLQNAQIVRRLCDRVLGIGADGAIFLEKNKKGWQWNFFNEDGSTPKMCGNGAKCTAAWLRRHGDKRAKSWSWQTKLGTARGEAGRGDLMWVRWPMPSSAPDRSIVVELGEILEGLNERGLAYLAFIDTGIPHLVLVNHESWTDTDRSTVNEQLRHHRAFGKAGTNVTWHSLGTGASVTFERGVEGETLACGTGAIAIHRALEDMGRGKKESQLQFPGGKLFVKRDAAGELWLGGAPAEVFSGELTL